MKFIKLASNYIQASEVSYVGKMERHINHASNSTTHYFLIVVGSQKVEINAVDKESTEALRNSLLESLEKA